MELSGFTPEKIWTNVLLKEKVAMEVMGKQSRKPVKI